MSHVKIIAQRTELAEARCLDRIEKKLKIPLLRRRCKVAAPSAFL
jgi:hypothetical protein